MRATDYGFGLDYQGLDEAQKAVIRDSMYIRLSPTQMVRVALVNGLGASLQPEHQKASIDAVYNYTDSSALGKCNIAVCAILMANKSRSESESEYLDDLLGQLDYESDVWEPFDFDDLEQRGFIREVAGLDGLVKAALSMDRDVVFCTKEPILDPETDFLKHVDWRNRLNLNGKSTIELFAQEKRFALPQSYHDYGRLTGEVLAKLHMYGFSFTQAIETGFRLLNAVPYTHWPVTTLSFRNPSNGDEVRIHLLDMIEALEHYVHRELVTKETIDFTFDEPVKYAQIESAWVPKRVPEENRRSHNTVECHYVPDFETRREMYDWMYLLPSCDCEYAFNMRNFQQKSGRSKRRVHTGDVHFLETMLEDLRHLEGGGWNNPKTLIPIPRDSLVRFADMLRYNCFAELQPLSVEDVTPKRLPLRETEIEACLFEFARKFGFERMFLAPREVPHPDSQIERLGYFLQPMYTI
jgi:hypothetical protein